MGPSIPDTYNEHYNFATEKQPLTVSWHAGRSISLAGRDPDVRHVMHDINRLMALSGAPCNSADALGA